MPEKEQTGARLQNVIKPQYKLPPLYKVFPTKRRLEEIDSMKKCITEVSVREKRGSKSERALYKVSAKSVKLKPIKEKQQLANFFDSQFELATKSIIYC